MIAVFTRHQEDFIQMGASPKNMFVRIKNRDSVLGCKFTGIIRLNDWYENKEVFHAHECLESRQPELFNN